MKNSLNAMYKELFDYTQWQEHLWEDKSVEEIHNTAARRSVSFFTLDKAEGEIMEQIAVQEPMIRRAMTIEEVFIKNEEERRFYELREKGRHDFDNAMITAEKRGKTEGKAGEKLEIACAMLAKDMSLELTAEITGLSIEELKNLRKGQ
jgi:predicted transposase/invertase (TIGR01784 family)